MNVIIRETRFGERTGYKRKKKDINDEGCKLR